MFILKVTVKENSSKSESENLQSEIFKEISCYNVESLENFYFRSIKRGKVDIF